MIDNYPNGAGVRHSIEAIRKFKNVDKADVNEYRDLIIDLMYSVTVLGFQYYEYFCYGFENKSIEEKLTFISNRDMMLYYKTINKDKEAAHILGNKYNTYLKFKDYFKRDVIKIADDSNQEKFMSFAAKHEKFILKPIGGALGRKIEIIDTKEYDSLDNVYNYIRSLKAQVVCEELIKQDKSFSQIHKESVNTVRVFTYCNNRKSKIVCSWIKSGSGTAVVDNAGFGGMLAAVDVKTGTVITDARTENAVTFERQPDTNFKFKGFKVPDFENLLDIAKEIALKIPEVPMIGWDFAYSEDRGWQLIEGNEGGQIFLIQIPLQEGRKQEYEKILEWEKWKNRR